MQLSQQCSRNRELISTRPSDFRINFHDAGCRLKEKGQSRETRRSKKERVRKKERGRARRQRKRYR